MFPSKPVRVRTCKAAATKSTARANNAKLDSETLLPRRDQHIQPSAKSRLSRAGSVESIGLVNHVQTLRTAYLRVLRCRTTKRKGLGRDSVYRIYYPLATRLLRKLPQAASISCALLSSYVFLLKRVAGNVTHQRRRQESGWH